MQARGSGLHEDNRIINKGQTCSQSLTLRGGSTLMPQVCTSVLFDLLPGTIYT